MPQNDIKISIVTVCFNDEDTILETIHSVREQTYQNFEYIIWDGDSKDNTLEIIWLNARAENVSIFCEKCNGFYHAMNSAVEKCSGDYVLFLNSGDVMADEDTLKDAAALIEKDMEKAALYFGNVFRKTKSRTVLETYSEQSFALRHLLSGNMPSPQSVFIKLELMKDYRFDESFSIMADYHFLMRCVRSGNLIRYIDRVISCYDSTIGIYAARSNDQEEVARQTDVVLKELYPLWYYGLKPVKRAVRLWKNRAVSVSEWKMGL